MKGPLGKKVTAPKKFDPKVLFPISRTDQRKGVFEKTDFSKIRVMMFGIFMSFFG